jgi:anti-sigma B factor antagonist
MNVEKTLNGTEMNVTIVGRLDTTTAPQLESEVKLNIVGVKKLILDFAGLEYLSSAGLRVLLALQKSMNKQGEMIIRNVNETIREIFELTGFIDILTIE